MVRFFIRLFSILLVLGLPFAALIRGAVYFHEQYDLGAYPSLLGGMALTIVIVVVYMSVFYSRMTNRLGSLTGLKSRSIFAGVVILGYVIHGLFFISAGNVKNADIAKEIHDLHPICRIALSTVIYVDKDLIITDSKRLPEDYHRMGLPTRKTSLHYKQKDGYAYAFDLRTNKRSEFRNFFLRNYFRVMGFQTLRHVGTDDHLHISLKCHYLPKSL